MKQASDKIPDHPGILFLNVLSLPTGGEFVGIENKLQMMDNLTGASTIREQYAEPFVSTVQTNASVILFCKEGEMTVRINNVDYQVGAGDVVIVISGYFFHVINYSDDFQFVAVALAYGYFDVTDNAILPMALVKHFMACPAFHVDPDTVNDFLGLYAFMKRKLMNKDFIYREEVARNCITTLVYMVHQILIDHDMVVDAPVTKTRQMQIFERFINEVNLHYIRERNVIFYASKLFITPKYLSMIVKQVSGKSATEWINDYVILEAKALLRVKWNSIKDVSNRLNFPNQSFFAKYFKQHTGLTPKQYRQKGDL